MWIQSLGRDNPLEGGMATYSNILAQRIPMDRRAWQATVHRVTQSQTRLYILMCVCAESLQLCLTLHDPMDCSPRGSSVHGILQAIILEWVAMPSSRGIFLTQGSNPCVLHLLLWQAVLYYQHHLGSWYVPAPALELVFYNEPYLARRVYHFIIIFFFCFGLS